MDVKVEKIEINVVKMEVTVPVEKFNEAVLKSYKKNSKRFNIPGFRKGKAPKAMVEKFYGESAFYEDAVGFIFDETYPIAVEQEGIFPVDYPKLDILQIGKDQEFKYIAEVTVKPEVKLGEYKGIEAKKVEYPVTDEDVDTQINAMREKNARIEDKTGDSVENGDIAVIDFEGFVNGEAFEGGKADNYELTVGSGTFIPGFEDQLIGVKLNETAEINVTFPEDYHEENLKGKPVLFKVTVKAVKVKQLPELDDEFAKDVSEFDTLEELKADTKKKQLETNQEKAKRDFEEEVVKKVVDASEVEIPEIMVEKETDYMLKDYDYRLRYQGITLDKYVELMGMTMDKLKEDFKEPAKGRVKTDLVLEAIAKAEDIKATDDEVNKKAEEIAKGYGSKDVEKIKSNILKGQKEIIAGEIVNNKVVDLLVKESKTID